MANYRIDSLPRPFVLTAFDTMQQTRDEAYPFTQEANFYWLTHIDEPGWLVIGDESSVSLVAPEKTEIQLLFEGGLSHEEASAKSGISTVLNTNGGMRLIKKLAAKHDVVYTLGRDPLAKYNTFTTNPAPARLRRQLRRSFKTVKDIRPQLTALRVHKQPDEIEKIRQAIAITQKAFSSIHGHINSYGYEYEIEADMTQIIRRSGAAGHAYEPIVASGKNALVMHYATNGDRLLDNSLVLIDVGAQLDGYAADITRTYMHGDASLRQQELHRVLVSAHEAIISCIKPGVTFKDYQAQSDVIMKDALMSLGLLHDTLDTETYRKYFPHAISHGLGLDVHESLGGDSFSAGMVLTVEPGIYIPEEGIGARVEDDILVTESGNDNLSESLSLGL